MSVLICTKTWGTCRKAVALLNEHKVDFEYREYKSNPLSIGELKVLLRQLDVPAHTLLRTRDKAYKANALTGNEDDETLLPLFEQFPTLMQRPIFILDDKAVICRPYDRLLELLWRLAKWPYDFCSSVHGT